MLKIYDGILSAVPNIQRDTWRTAKRIVTKLRNNGRGARTMNGRKGKETGGGMEKKRNAGRMKKDVRERERAS